MRENNTLLTTYIKVPLYRGYFGVIISDSIEDVEHEVGEWNPGELFAHSIVTDYRGKTAFVIVLNFNNKHGKITHGTIAHEASHIAHFIAERRGFRPTFLNDEPIAYLIEWVTNNVYDFIKKHNFKVI